MRKSIFFVFSVFILTMMLGTGCTEKKVDAQDSTSNDSTLIDTLGSDSIDEIIAERPMPKAADELFDDFIFNFAASKKVQRERTDFPLTVDRYGKISEVTQRQWSMEHFFMRQGYYTLIFNNARQMNLVKDTAVSNIFVEKISFANKSVHRWQFNRVQGAWRLQALKVMSLDKHEDASFLKFYEDFATDSVMQMQSLAEQVSFSVPDPDDDFSRMDGELMPEQWPMFAPWLPSGELYNIHYGEHPYKSSDTRIFIIRGISNGLETELTFKRQDGRWTLIKLNT